MRNVLILVLPMRVGVEDVASDAFYDGFITRGGICLKFRCL